MYVSDCCARAFTAPCWMMKSPKRDGLIPRSVPVDTDGFNVVVIYRSTQVCDLMSEYNVRCVVACSDSYGEIQNSSRFDGHLGAVFPNV